MMSSVGQRPNHYETLGITPAASDEDIARAFARKMNAFRWHPAGAAAGVWIAYETLRDRLRRADYDRALGLAPEPKREWTMAVTREQWTPLVAPAAATAVRELPREPERRPEPPIDPRLESIAATLRALSSPSAERSPDPAPRLAEQREAPKSEDGFTPLIEHILAVEQAEKSRLRVAEVRAPDWRKPVLIVGGLLLSAGLIGAYAGLSASENQQQTQAETAKNSAGPTAKRHAVVSPAATVLAPAPVASGLDLDAPRPTRSVIARPKSGRAASRNQVRERVAAATPSETADSAASNQPASDPLAPQPAAANLPLPNKVIARTIDRIGYSCGEVASSAAVDGSPGAFTVTCSSGQSFQATRVHGRYHFRRAR
jgi:hypothetical protein